MLISLPFLADAVIDADDDMLRYAMGGSYPVTSHLEWHNGVHLVSPTVDAPVRAIADGKVIYVVKPDTQPSQDLNHPQNYGAADGTTKLWTDKGMLILAHETEIGANGTTPVALKYYSVYMHLKTLEADVAVGKTLYRKDKLGQPGQIYGQSNHMHFEICMNEANITTLLGHAPADHPAGEKAPTGDGRTDVVFGDTYVYLPADTPVLDAEPSTHMSTTSTQKLDTALWVQIAYAGSATLTSYYALGDKAGIQIGQRSDAEAEYKLYTTANDRHTKAVQAQPTAKSSPSGWYELLRFGRNLGRGPAATDKDPLPANAEHWRKICTPAGEKWANLNAEGTLKFSDADFPSFLGWQCISDDENTSDQRCDSPTLRTLLAVSIEDMAEREKALKKTPAGRSMLAKQLKSAKLKDKLPRLICKYPSEFDQGELEARYGHVKEEDEFKTNQKNWDQFQAHIKALTQTDLPKEYKEDAQWHVHPVAFIQLMKKCGWLGTNEMYQLFPPSAMRPAGASWVSENITITKERVSAYRFALNKACRKYCVTTPQRMATFYANAMQETMWFNSLRENNSSARYYPWDGRGFLQLTWPNNYVKYFRFVGKTVSATDATALQIAQQTSDQQRSNTALVNADSHIASELTRWRNDIGDGIHLDASANSAGAYWAWSSAAQQADALSVNVRATKTVNGHQVAYYTNASMGNVAATVNVGHPSTNYASVNGIVARFQAYAACQMVLLDSPSFPDAQGTMKPNPENYTQRRP